MAVRRGSFAFGCAAAAALVVAAYANSFRNSFHFDDAHVIETNVYIRSLHNVPLFFTDAHTFSSLPQNSTYRPLVTLSLALDYARGGLDPAPYHVTQIVLLMVTGALLLIFFTPLIGEWPALFAATLFCVHTANTETMNLISARSELLSAIGLLGSFVLFQRSPFARRTLLYLIPLALGSLAKAPVVVFAPLLFFYVRWFEEKRNAWRDAVPPLILGIIAIVVLNRMNAPEWKSGGGDAYGYVMTQPWIWLHYVRLFFLPAGLTADTDWTALAHWYDTRAIAGDVFVILLIVAIARIPRRPIKFGLTWFAIALVPTSLFPLAEVANEHRVFFAYMGLVLALGDVGRTLVRPGRVEARPTFAIAILIAFAIGTFERNKVWRTEETLWADVVRKSPANGRAWMNYGLTQMVKGQFAAAKSSFEQAATLVPNYSTLEINRGIVEGELGDQASAEMHFRRALALNPDAYGHYYYARWLVQGGRGPEALPHLIAAIHLSPAFADPRALLLQINGGSDASFSSYDAAFRAGLEAIGKSDWASAAEANRQALRFNPRSADAWNNLGWAYQKMGFLERAAPAYENALAIQPDYERARNNLALIRKH